MVIITGILGFMMTPGRWLETGGFFSGFFNQTYWPQLLFRTSMMFAIAGCYAALVPAILNNGIFLMLYAWFFKPRSGAGNT